MMLFQPDCRCCQAKLWHCEECWNNHHNGRRDHDFIPPKYPGQPLIDPAIVDAYLIRKGMKGNSFLS